MSLPELPTNRRFLTRLFNSLAAPPPAPPAPSSPDAAASLTDDKHHPNPLDSVPLAVKKQLLSLQVLFPTEFVPALDVLDRHLVTRFRIRNHPSPSVHRQDGHHYADVVMRLGGDDDDGDNDEEMHMSDDAQHKDATRTSTTKHTSLPHEEATSTTSVPVNVTTSAYDNTKSSIYYVQSAQHHRSSRYSSTSSSSDQTPTYQVRLTTWSCSCPAFTFAAFPANPSPPSTPLANHHDNDSHENNDTPQDHPWIFGGITLGDDMPPVCKHLLACLLAEKCKNLFGQFITEKVVSVDEAAGWAAGWGD
ncbi:hypothetical protein COCMIDRAFT_6490 [Bipolaris oryzae ATCC 44560]|uniref:SWIM-type domain-containing protein n=1 Tax=Bipolaris oryzae ATCC 44560 TaxID=930090 RepID=W6YXV6_COCMI|nr:uncharacterized protein COCMIDRAFT_6490 [Bipolaris oryzae ATCC 44560]EUC44167.1 hypothetical protein COCMIDRAFT_6490 [Bipolaris oryzae ATCC 44560]